MLDRRGFLATLAAAFVTDPERLLWVPGKKLISVPKPNHAEWCMYSPIDPTPYDEFMVNALQADATLDALPADKL